MRITYLSAWLWLLTLVFVIRVLGQLGALWLDVPLLPTFDQWYSGAVAYPVLLGFQCLIIAVMVLVSLKISRSAVVPNKNTGLALFVIGTIYFSVMLIRWFIGIFDLLDITWFQRPIPSFFHMVLASYILLLGYYHRARDSSSE